MVRRPAGPTATAHGPHSLGTIMIHDDRLVGIVALDAGRAGRGGLHRAVRRWASKRAALAHGSPSLFWLDLPLDGPGAADFKVLLKAKLRTCRTAADASHRPPVPASRATKGSARSPRRLTPPPASDDRRRSRRVLVFRGRVRRSGAWFDRHSSVGASSRQSERETMAAFGTLTLLIALVVATYAGAASLVGVRRGSRRLIESGRGGVYALAAVLGLSSVAIWSTPS